MQPEEVKEQMVLDDIRSKIREIRDWPQKGVTFRDVCPLFEDSKTFMAVIDILKERYSGYHIDLVAGVEARGFVVGAALAYALGVGFVALRKQGKLPGPCLSKSYELEYGSATLEVQSFIDREGKRVLVIDDLLAKGGTMEAACELVEYFRGQIVECVVIAELVVLQGRKRVEARGWKLWSLLTYENE
eukprot:jgi/Galph1/426/GphlegSOOS_G5250.1